MVGYQLLVRGPVRDGRVVERGAGTISLPPSLNADGIVVVMGHPASMLGVPVESNLGCGVVGQVARVRSLGPLHVLDLAIGYRQVEVGWEWDPMPPPVGATLAIAVQPGTMRFFGTASGSRAVSSNDHHDGAAEYADDYEERSRVSG